jgi:hypothetical protein
MIEKLKPTKLLVYGVFPDSWKENISQKVEMMCYNSYTVDRKKDNAYG